MASLMTNASAMTALQTLSMINKSMDVTQNRISTGLRVQDASQNAAYWSIATTMRSDNGALGTVQDALGLGAATIDVMYTALNATVDVVKEIKNRVTAASQPGVDRGKVQADITQLQNQLRTIAASAVFNGENWLQFDSGNTAATAPKQVVGSFTRDTTGAVSLETIDITVYNASPLVGGTLLVDLAGTPTGILDFARAFTYTGASVSGASVLSLDINAAVADADTAANMQVAVQMVDQALSDITRAATDLGSSKKRVDMQKDFVSALRDAIDRGIGQLVDADMNKESSVLKATQVQQQLGIQALGIANANSQNILALFR